MESLLDQLDDAHAPQHALLPVLLPVALDQTYDYRMPEMDAGGVPRPGAFVQVPFGPQRRIGVVWDRAIGEGKPVKPEKMKAIDSVLDVPPLPEISLRFAEWIARYTLTPLGMVLRMMMSASAVFEPSSPPTTSHGGKATWKRCSAVSPTTSCS